MSKYYEKYHIEKADGSPCDPNAKYFVLRFDKDPYARIALSAYAKAIQVVDPEFAEDIGRILKETEVNPSGTFHPSQY